MRIIIVFISNHSARRNNRIAFIVKLNLRFIRLSRRNGFAVLWPGQGNNNRYIILFNFNIAVFGRFNAVLAHFQRTLCRIRRQSDNNSYILFAGQRNRQFAVGRCGNIALLINGNRGGLAAANLINSCFNALFGYAAALRNFSLTIWINDNRRFVRALKNKFFAVVSFYLYFFGYNRAARQNLALALHRNFRLFANLHNAVSFNLNANLAFVLRLCRQFQRWFAAGNLYNRFCLRLARSYRQITLFIAGNGLYNLITRILLRQSSFFRQSNFRLIPACIHHNLIFARFVHVNYGQPFIIKNRYLLIRFIAQEHPAAIQPDNVQIALAIHHVQNRFFRHPELMAKLKYPVRIIVNAKVMVIKAELCLAGNQQGLIVKIKAFSQIIISGFQMCISLRMFRQNNISRHIIYKITPIIFIKRSEFACLIRVVCFMITGTGVFRFGYITACVNGYFAALAALFRSISVLFLTVFTIEHHGAARFNFYTAAASQTGKRRFPAAIIQIKR